MLWMNRGRRGNGVLGVEIRDTGVAYAFRPANEPAASQPYSTTRHGYVASVTEMPTAIVSALSGTNLKHVVCNVTLAPEDSFLVQVATPPVAEDEMLEALQWSIRDVVDYKIEDTIIDAFPVPDDALRGRDPMMNVVGARKPRLRSVIDTCKSLGISVHSIDIAELSLRNLARCYVDDDKPIAVMLLEHGSGNILIFKNDALYFSRKITCSGAVFEGVDDEDTRNARDQVCLELQRSLDYFQSQLGQVAPRQVLVAAGPGTVDLQLAIINNLDIEPIVLELEDMNESDFPHQPCLIRAVGGALRRDTIL